MKEKRLIIPNKITLDLQATKDRIKENWPKLLLAAAVVLLLVQKDLSFQFNMGNRNLQSGILGSSPLPSDQMNLSGDPKPQSTSLFLDPKFLSGSSSNPRSKKDKVALCKEYIDRFAPTAIVEMKKYGIPASITLAQGLLESNAGGSRLARENNNHFGMKCFSKKCGKNHCSNFEDDHHKDFFRKYETSWESFRAHSQLLNGKRYRHLKKLNRKDYKSWANGLQKAGYATDKRYAKKLITFIEQLNLNQYDS